MMQFFPCTILNSLFIATMFPVYARPSPGCSASPAGTPGRVSRCRRACHDCSATGRTWSRRTASLGLTIQVMVHWSGITSVELYRFYEHLPSLRMLIVAQFVGCTYSPGERLRLGLVRSFSLLGSVLALVS